MGVLTDLWESLPPIVKFVAVLAIFLYAGTTILQAITIIWNLLGVNAINAVNGCLAGNQSLCIPQQEGIYIFGINVADYWTITVIMFAMILIPFTAWWYANILKKD